MKIFTKAGILLVFGQQLCVSVHSTCYIQIVAQRILLNKMDGHSQITRFSLGRFSISESIPLPYQPHFFSSLSLSHITVCQICGTDLADGGGGEGTAHLAGSCQVYNTHKHLNESCSIWSLGACQVPMHSKSTSLVSQSSITLIIKIQLVIIRPTILCNISKKKCFD